MTAAPAVFIIGGGPAGAAAACRLAAAGLGVTLAERTTGPHDTICGEFLSIEAQTALTGLGIDPVALGAEPIHHLRLVHGRRTATVALPFAGRSLSRRVLDEALLARAAALGATVRRGETVRAMITQEGHAYLAGAPAAECGPVILATGKHALRGAVRRTIPGDRVGFKMYYRLTPQAAAGLAGAVEIHLFPDGYAGFEPVEGDRANLCLLISRTRLASLGAWPAVLAWLCAQDPHLAASLAGATPLLDRPLTIAGVPYGFVHRPSPQDPDNLYRVGDQMAVIPSFCGDGLAIALQTGLAAATAITTHRTAGAYHARLRQDLKPQMVIAAALTRLGAAWPGHALVLQAARWWPALIRTAVVRTRMTAIGGDPSEEGKARGSAPGPRLRHSHISGLKCSCGAG